MRATHTFLVFTSGGLLGAAVAGAVYFTCRARHHLGMLGTWQLCERDVLLDLKRLA